MSTRARLKKLRAGGAPVIIAAPVFFLGEFGLGWALGWMDNSLCFRYFGCNAGFFGYDAFVHFLGGILEATFMLWLAKNYRRLNIFHETFWKNLFVLIAIVALISISWEMFEFSYDHVQTNLLHEDILHPYDVKLQPSNDDTMGDLTFGLLGALSAIVILKLFDSKSL